MERSLHTFLRASSRSTKKWSWPSALWGGIPILKFTRMASEKWLHYYQWRRFTANSIVVRDADTVPRQHQLQHQLVPSRRDQPLTPMWLVVQRRTHFVTWSGATFSLPSFRPQHQCEISTTENKNRLVRCPLPARGPRSAGYLRNTYEVHHLESRYYLNTGNGRKIGKNDPSCWSDLVAIMGE